PPNAGVGFVTGATMANFTCLGAARHALLRRAGWDVEADGLFGAPELPVIVGAHAHSTLFQALRYLGLGSARAARIPTDPQCRMNADNLATTLQRLRDRPVLVCAQAGEINTGAIDPMDEIAEACAAHGNAWLHVDGAFGLWAQASPMLSPMSKGVERAD